MTQFNPVVGSIIQGQAAQRQQPVEKARQVRKAQVREKNVAAHTDQFEPQVESVEHIDPIHDDDAKRRQNDRRQGAAHPPAPDDATSAPEAPPHLDVRA